MYQMKYVSILLLVCMAILTGACESESLSMESKDERSSEAMSTNVEVESDEVDEPVGFEVDVLAPHAPFADELAAQFRLKFSESGGESIVNNLKDVSTMIVAEVNWKESGSTSGWHLHPGIALVNVVEGEIEVIWENECTPRTYSTGDGWLDPGDIHKADAVSDGATAYVTFLGIPDGKPATEWVEPADCR